MEKQALNRIKFFATAVVIIGGWLWAQSPEQKDQVDDFIYSESVTYHFENPQKGDLYLVLDSEKRILEYFKLVWLEENGRLGVIMGNDSTHLLSRKYHSPNFTIEMLSEDYSYDDSLVIKQKDQLAVLLQENGDKSLKIYRQQQTVGMDLFRKIIFTPLGFIGVTIFSFFLIWIGRSISGFIEAIYAIEKKWIEVPALVLICFFLNPFIFPHWAFELLFSLLSVISAYYFTQRRINKLALSEESIESREMTLILRIMIWQSLLQLIIFLLFSEVAVKNFGNNPFLADDSYREIGTAGSSFILAAFAIGNFLNNLRKYLKELTEKNKQLSITQLKAQQSKAELDALQSKVNPHFLYNSLNSIAGLAQENPEKTEEMAIALSHFYKQSTNRKGEHWNTIEEAIELLHTYLEIEKIRFGDRLQFEIRCPEYVKEEKIPRFLLQPLVENAIKYGYQASTNSMTIRLELEKIGKELQIRLYDQGMPFPDNLQAGYGVQSVQKKLELLYPDRHELAFINAPEKQVSILLVD